jgi:predicted DNA-binding protein YlxM (UPF0122 family)
LKATEGAARVNEGEVELKHEEESADEEIIDSIEEYDYQEMTDQDYEVVYETSLPGVNDEEIDEKPKNELTSKAKRKSKTLTFRQKYEVIKQIEIGAPVTQICEFYGIGRTTVYDYMRRKQEIIDFIEKSNDACTERKTFKKSKFPEVEKRVLEWCELNEMFTKQDFYDCAKSAFDEAREQNSTLSPSGFCGSWSWTKRFFHRHPDLKQKLVNASGLPLDPAELSMSNAEYLDETDENIKGIHKKFLHIKSDVENVKKVKFLNLSEKLQVLDQIDIGISVPNIAAKFNVSKSTVYEIFKRRLDLSETKVTSLNSLQKVSTPRYPQLELELLQWCLKQQNFPLSNVLIADKALCLFDEMQLTGAFNPSSSWAKKFVLRYAELWEKQGLAIETEETELSQNEDSLHHEFIEDDEIMQDEDSSLQFPDPDSLAVDYEEEYILEEIESQHDEQLEIEPVEIKPEPISQKKALKTIKHDDNMTFEIPDAIALKSLKILIKYSEQRGHDILSHLTEYRSQLEDSVT